MSTEWINADRNTTHDKSFNFLRERGYFNTNGRITVSKNCSQTISRFDFLRNLELEKIKLILVYIFLFLFSDLEVRFIILQNCIRSKSIGAKKGSSKNVTISNAK